jgi:hypothetical protein
MEHSCKRSGTSTNGCNPDWSGTPRNVRARTQLHIGTNGGKRSRCSHGMFTFQASKNEGITVNKCLANFKKEKIPFNCA